MVETGYKYFCDFCKCEIPPKEYWGNNGVEITIKDGIVARPVKMDLCKSCFENMKTFCKTHKKENEDA